MADVWGTAWNKAIAGILGMKGTHRSWSRVRCSLRTNKKQHAVSKQPCNLVSASTHACIARGRVDKWHWGSGRCQWTGSSPSACSLVINGCIHRSMPSPKQMSDTSSPTCSLSRAGHLSVAIFNDWTSCKDVHVTNLNNPPCEAVAVAQGTNDGRALGFFDS